MDFLETSYKDLPKENAILEWLIQDITEESLGATPEVLRSTECDSSDISEDKSDTDSDFNFNFVKCLTDLTKMEKEKSDADKENLKPVKKKMIK